MSNTFRFWVFKTYDYENHGGLGDFVVRVSSLESARVYVNDQKPSAHERVEWRVIDVETCDCWFLAQGSEPAEDKDTAGWCYETTWMKPLGRV